MDDLPPGPAGGPPATGPLASRAVGLFRQGNVNGAIQAIESAGSSDAKLQKLLADLRGFAGALQEGETYYRGKQDEGAIKALGRAIQYGKIVAPSGDNAYAQKIAGMIADMYYLRGVKAFYKENYLIAAQNFQQALKFKPDHQQSQNKLKEMSAVAGRLYEEGYVLKAADPEGAKKKFQTIIQITPPDNDYHKKAKDWLKRL
ncbi:MAG: hypothetical protein HY897_26390 [Deltaproteobacteria bacterium]|nr:hypothetical protein [Deltaproteobacteria bacterium]